MSQRDALLRRAVRLRNATAIVAAGWGALGLASEAVDLPALAPVAVAGVAVCLALWAWQGAIIRRIA